MSKFLVPEVLLLLVILYFGFVRFFRKSPTARKVVEETLGDNTPEAALREYYLARDRLAAHLDNEELPVETVQQIEQALGLQRK